MQKHSPRKHKQVLRRQGTIILALIIIVVACILAISALLIADRFSGKAEMSNSSLRSGSLMSETPSEITTLETTPTPETTLESTSTTTTTLATTVATTVATTMTTTTTTTSESSVVTSESSKVPETTIDAGTTSPPTLPQNTSGPDLTGHVVVLDPGHQQTPNRDQEPLSPTMSGSKDKVSSGTQGVETGRPEYEVNLEIGLLLRDYLESLGCTVYMTRTENNVDISNIERAEFALSYSPDAYIRLHCDGSSDSSRKGIGVFVANSGKHESSLVGWADLLGQAISNATGSTYRGCNASSRYSGLNWATDIPSFLLEMGYMSNATEDVLLSDNEYQLKICKGIADFISQMPINPDRV